MALAHRVIPTLLTRGRVLVKGQRFDAWRSVGVTAQAVRVHQARGCDELILLDIAATPEGRGPDLELVRELAEVCFMPLTVGGGIRSFADAQALLAAGADKVAICTGSLRTIQECADRLGAQAIVAAIDVATVHTHGLSIDVAHVRCGTLPIGWDPAALARQYAKAGAGELLLTSIESEGTMIGYDLELIRTVSRAVDIPVIAHGGCASYDDMVKAIRAGASAVAAGALFQFTDATPREAAQWLADHGIEARV